MNAEIYLFDIRRATDAATLHGLRATAIADDSLHSTEKDEICAAVDARFGKLNAQTVGKQTPRWK